MTAKISAKRRRRGWSAPVFAQFQSRGIKRRGLPGRISAAMRPGWNVVPRSPRAEDEFMAAFGPQAGAERDDPG